MMKQSESQCTNHTNPQNKSFSFISIPHCPPLKYTTPQIKHQYDATLSSWRNDSRSRANAKTGRVLPFRFYLVLNIFRVPTVLLFEFLEGFAVVDLIGFSPSIVIQQEHCRSAITSSVRIDYDRKNGVR